MVAAFKEAFPNQNIEVMTKEELESMAGSPKFAEFKDKFKDMVPEYKRATFVRLRADEANGTRNSILVPRVRVIDHDLNTQILGMT
ncbi:unnamed protein product [Caenorhabditis nigoni]